MYRIWGSKLQGWYILN